jgi:hypothetical protein
MRGYVKSERKLVTARHHAWIQLDIPCARGLWFHLATGFKIIARMLGGEPLGQGLRGQRSLENIGFMADGEDPQDGAEPENALAGPEVPPLHDPGRLLDELSKEYYAVVGIVSGFDQRLMTIKGWSVTVSLAALGLAFQQGHYALFGLAAGTGLVFWIIDILTKRHQMRYYPRMRDIEVAASKLNNVKLRDGKVLSAPRVDWTWLLPGKRSKRDWRHDPPGERTQKEIRQMLRRAPWMGNVMLPHLVAVVLGLVLFFLAVFNVHGLAALKP